MSVSGSKSDFWSDDDFQTEDDKIRFEEAGDRFTGKLLSMSKAVMPNGDQAPRLVLEDTTTGKAMILIAGATDLKRKLIKHAPQVGNIVDIHLDDVKALGGGRSFKTYSVAVDRVS